MKKIFSLVIFAVLLLGIAFSVPFVKQPANATAPNRSMENFNEFSNAVMTMVSQNENSSNIVQSKDKFENAESAFSSKRLIVRIDGKIDERGAISHASGFDNYHVLQYETEQQARSAWKYYNSLKNVIYAVPDVKISLDPTYKAGPENEDAPKSSDGFLTWGAKTIGAENYQQYLKSLDTLNEVVVAVIDSGLDVNHEHFENRIAEGGRNFNPDTEDPDSVVDTLGHGTHVAGTIVDLTLPNVKVLPVQVWMWYDDALLSSAVSSIEYVAVLNQERGNIVAANMSWGIDQRWDILDGELFAQMTQTLCMAVDALYNANVLPVAAAGNAGMNDSVFATPGNLSNSITVSAVGKDDFPWVNERGTGLADFSSWGKAINIAAPGVDILSSVPGNRYMKGSGTSMASPHVAAAVALLKSDSTKTLTKEDVKDILYFNARDNGILGFDEFYGHGILNVRHAYAEMLDATITFSRVNEVFTDAFNLSMTIAYPNAKIFYTLDGSMPKTDSTPYSGSIAISKTTVVRAIAYVFDGGKITARSAEFSAIYYHSVGGVLQDIENAFEIGHFVIGERWVWDEDEQDYVWQKIFSEGEGLVRYRGVLKNLVIPEYIELIGPRAFFITPVESVTLPDSLEYIGLLAFAGAIKLETVYAPNVKEVDRGAFIFTSLKQITDENFPKLETIGWSAFAVCYDLEYVNLSNVKYVDYFAFYWTAIKEVILPSAQNIGLYAFEPHWGVKDHQLTVVLGKDIQRIEREIDRWNCEYEKIYIDGINVIVVGCVANEMFGILYGNYAEIYFCIDGDWYDNEWGYGEPMGPEWLDRWQWFLDKTGIWAIIDGEVMALDTELDFIDYDRIECVVIRTVEEFYLDGTSVIYVRYWPYWYVEINGRTYYYIDGNWYDNEWGEGEPMGPEWLEQWSVFLEQKESGEWIIVNGEVLKVDYMRYEKYGYVTIVGEYEETYIIDGVNVILIRYWPYWGEIEINGRTYYHIDGNWYDNEWGEGEPMYEQWVEQWQDIFQEEYYSEFVMIEGKLFKVDGWQVYIHYEHKDYACVIKSEEKFYLTDIDYIRSYPDYGEIVINYVWYYLIDGNWYDNYLGEGEPMDQEWIEKWQRFFDKYGTFVIIDGEDIEVDWLQVYIDYEPNYYIAIVDEETVEWIAAIPSYAVIVGYTDTEAESYAQKVGNTFIAIDLAFIQDLTEVSLVDGVSVILVEVQGYGLQYQWYENGVEIPGETSSSLEVTNESIGKEYYVVVTDWLGDSVISAVYTVENINLTFYSITIICGENGQISPSTNFEALRGSDINFEITPDVGFELDKVLVNGQPISVIGNKFTVQNLAADTTIEVMFKQTQTIPLTTYTITISVNGYGTANPVGVKTVNAGTDTEITFTANEGYKVEKVLVNGINIGSVKTYTVKNIDENVSIVVYFVESSSSVNTGFVLTTEQIIIISACVGGAVFILIGLKIILSARKKKV